MDAEKQAAVAAALAALDGREVSPVYEIEAARLLVALKASNLRYAREPSNATGVILIAIGLATIVGAICMAAH